MSSLKVVPIHQHTEYFQDCCKIINQEWKRSELTRLHSLKQSNDKLPTSLILLKDKIVIGHIKLSVIPSIRSACFAESVVIDKNLRGNGYGTLLMQETEKYCKSIGLKTVYLSTKGQQHFYTKLGYEKCAPISLYGDFVNKITYYISNNKGKEDKQKEEIKNVIKRVDDATLPPPPPPPPMPQDAQPKQIEKVYMKKELLM